MIKTDKETMKRIEDTLKQTIKNPYWKKEYDEAPSDECKDYLKFTYFFSKHYDPDADDAEKFDEIQKQVESALSAEDWAYLKKMAPSSPFVAYCDENIKRLAGK